MSQAKKVLIITYYWPPAGGPGVQRWLKFVKYLPQFGFHPVVYVPENPNYPILDHELELVPSGEFTLIKQPIKEPFKWAGLVSGKATRTISSGIISADEKQGWLERLMLYIRGNYFIPDARKAWIKPSVTFLNTFLSEQDIDTVITTGPPHSLHLIGLGLKKRLNINWMADFRDPWTSIGYHKKLKLTESSAQKHRALEQQVLNSADHILVTSNNTKKEFSTITERPITVITNGYDRQPLPKIEKEPQFSLSHIGSLLSGRNPHKLWKVLGELIKERPDFAHNFRLRLAGVVSAEVLKDIRGYIPEGNLIVEGYVDHYKALVLQRQSRLLLLVEIDSEDTKAIIPGKLYEYMVAATPIMAIGPMDSDVEQIINSTNTGQYFTYGQEEDLKVYLSRAYENFLDGTLKTAPVGLQQYSRQALTQKLAQVLKQLPTAAI